MSPAAVRERLALAPRLRFGIVAERKRSWWIVKHLVATNDVELVSDSGRPVVVQRHWHRFGFRPLVRVGIVHRQPVGRAAETAESTGNVQLPIQRSSFHLATTGGQRCSLLPARFLFDWWRPKEPASGSDEHATGRECRCLPPADRWATLALIRLHRLAQTAKTVSYF